MEVDRHELPQTPELDFDIGVGNDFSLPVVDFDSSFVLLLTSSVLERGVGSPNSDLLESAESPAPVAVAMFGESTVDDEMEFRMSSLEGRPIMPGGACSLLLIVLCLKLCKSIEAVRLREPVARFLYVSSFSGRTSGTDSWFRSSSNMDNLSWEKRISAL